jgi:hypothetical protein
MERVSIKGAMTGTWDMSETPQQLSDRELMEFVRATPSLKWFRSDLSPESVAILQQERPEVHFVM